MSPAQQVHTSISPVHGVPGVRTEAFLGQKSGDVQLATTEWLSCCFVCREKARLCFFLVCPKDVVDFMFAQTATFVLFCSSPKLSSSSPSFFFAHGKRRIV